MADARAAWDYIQGVLERGGVSAASDKIVIAGQSLGTGVSALLAGQLATEGKLAACGQIDYGLRQQVHDHGLSP